MGKEIVLFYQNSAASFFFKYSGVVNFLLAFRVLRKLIVTVLASFIYFRKWMEF